MKKDLNMEKECAKCHGRGKINNTICAACNGTGTVLTEDGLKILKFLRDGIRTSES
ncbi:hypothetical protein [Sporomusa malonica]|uniref:Tryptophan RNA-binding attenuator protein inhibitory protein n=1 Tax=Sporomusa malonica TaxID=112901 RepID=A0A1W2EBJ9_9FIRM|nr:hypothetical protein [Sporomusa malonica]SMD06706.1 Tryptophan RNA-binding attenuator protein inhibitory protein [Sporomusa malonica]